MHLIGFVALSDPPRDDSSSLISQLQSLGVRTVMVTGDAPATAAIVAHAVGLNGAVCPPGAIPDSVKPEDYAVFASVLPEGKFNLVRAFQKNGHAVGMCGDGANALVRRGEATAKVTATGAHTKFGRTAELVQTAHVVSSQQKAVLRIVRNLAVFNGLVIVLIGGYAYFHAMPWSEVVPLLLTSVLAAIPVAPA